MKKARTAALIGTACIGSALAFTAFADDHKHDHHDHDHKEHKHEKHDHEHHHDHDEHEHHGKHEHGVADMDIALDNGQLLVQLKSPAANFVGFEHEPSTKEQKKAYANMAKTLNKPKKIIDLDGGKCKITDTDVDLPFEVESDHHHDHDHGHHHDEHKHEAHHDEHKHEKHDDHEGHDHEKHESTHSDIAFKYMYTCKKPTQLEHVDVELFKRFKGFEKINVQWIANNQQGSATLTPKNTTVELHKH